MKFDIPDGYFDTLADNVMQSIDFDDRRRRRRRTNVLRTFGAMMVVAFVACIAVFGQQKTHTDLSGNEQQQFFELFKQLMRSSYMRDLKDLQQWTQQVRELGRERQKRLLEYFQRLIRENFIYNFHQAEMSFQTQEEQQFSQRFAPFINEINVIGIMDELSDAQRDIEQNVNAQMVFFDFALKMIILLKK
jgi:hypothetical protein